MNNKKQIQKLRDNAELAWASYGYFHFLGKQFKDDDLKALKRQENPNITQTDILDMTYKGYKVKDTGLIFDDKLDGDMTPIQVKNFFEKYDLLDFYPKFDTKNNKQKEGFHACLFQDKESKQYTLAIRGSFDSTDYTTDFVNLLKDSTIPLSFFKNL